MCETGGDSSAGYSCLLAVSQTLISPVAVTAEVHELKLDCKLNCRLNCKLN